MNAFPFGSIPLVVTVRVLPSAETAIFPVMVTWPPFLMVIANVWSSTFVYDRMSEVGIAGHWIFLAVERTGPLVVRRLAIRIRAVDGDLDVIASGHIDDRVVPRVSGTELGLALIQLPGADLRVRSEGGRRDQTHERR